MSFFDRQSSVPDNRGTKAANAVGAVEVDWQDEILACNTCRAFLNMTFMDTSIFRWSPILGGEEIDGRRGWKKNLVRRRKQNMVR